MKNIGIKDGGLLNLNDKWTPNEFNTYNTNLDACTIGFSSDLFIVPYSLPTYHVSAGSIATCRNSETHTSYHLKLLTALWSITIPKSVDTLLLSVSFKPIFVDFALLFDVLVLSAVFIPWSLVKKLLKFEKKKNPFFFALYSIHLMEGPAHQASTPITFL